MRRYFKIWLCLARIRFIEFYVQSRLNSIFLVLGKLVRFSFFLIFIVALLTKTQSIAGFSLYQTLLFYMTFNFIDITSQFFSRGVYNIKGMIDNGLFDKFLTQPINVLFRVFSDLIDILDLTTLIPVLITLGLVIARLESSITFVHFIAYLALCLNGLLIALSVHIFIVSFSVLTQQVPNSIWIYRDLITMGRFPVNIYAQSIQFFLTFILPIAVMVSFPAKALIGILAFQNIIIAFAVSFTFLLLSLLTWKKALQNYSSVSA